MPRSVLLALDDKPSVDECADLGVMAGLGGGGGGGSGDSLRDVKELRLPKESWCWRFPFPCLGPLEPLGANAPFFEPIDTLGLDLTQNSCRLVSRSAKEADTRGGGGGLGAKSPLRSAYELRHCRCNLAAFSITDKPGDLGRLPVLARFCGDVLFVQSVELVAIAFMMLSDSVLEGFCLGDALCVGGRGDGLLVGLIWLLSDD